MNDKFKTFKIQLSEEHVRAITDGGKKVTHKECERILRTRANGLLGGSNVDEFLEIKNYEWECRRLASDLYKDYISYCDDTDGSVLGRKHFYDKLRSLGYLVKISTANALYVSNVDLSGRTDVKDVMSYFSSNLVLTAKPLKRTHKLKEVYNDYLSVCSQSGKRPEGSKTFNKILTKNGIVLKISTGNNLYIYGYELDDML